MDLFNSPTPCRLLVVAGSNADSKRVLDILPPSYQVTSATVLTLDGVCEALEHTTWDLVLYFDGGFEPDARAVLEATRSRAGDVPFILVTTAVAPEMDALLQYGANETIESTRLRDDLVPTMVRQLALKASRGRHLRRTAHDIATPLAVLVANQVSLGRAAEQLRAFVNALVSSPDMTTLLATHRVEQALRDLSEVWAENTAGLERVDRVLERLRDTCGAFLRRPDPLPHFHPSSRRILVVDDDHCWLDACERMLMPDHDVRKANGGAQALDILDRDRAWDVIFCDLIMPAPDGPAVYETLKDLAPELLGRFVFMTGGAFTLRAAEFLTGVPNVIVEKPLRRETILAAISRCTANRFN